jgi:t-SNARE complex subunit (syntaxin)
MDPVPDSLLLRKPRSPGNRTRTSGSVARNSDHSTTEAIAFIANEIRFKQLLRNILIIIIIIIIIMLLLLLAQSTQRFLC